MTTFPVTASTLSEKALGDFIREKHNLNEQFECQLFRTGVNHTYFIADPKVKYVVRVYCHNWRTKTEIREELKLLKLLKENKLSVSYPIADKDGKLIQEVKAPEGPRYAVVFTFAEGKKMRFMPEETCSAIGTLMAQIHNLTANKNLDRVNYNSEVLIEESYDCLEPFFSENLAEMRFLRKIGKEISEAFLEISLLKIQKGVVHLDIWYDNLSVNRENEITVFDFDNCRNGFLILDIDYFCKQLFFIESDKEQYELKVESFLSVYRKIREISDEEIEFILEAGASIFAFYLGVQAKRFDWSNVFLTENYLKMFVGRIEFWMNYHQKKRMKV